MDREDFLFIGRVGVLTLTLLIAVIALVLGPACLLDRMSCQAHWDDSGLAVRWSALGGCQLHQKDGTWLTDDAYLALTKNVNVNGGG